MNGGSSTSGDGNGDEEWLVLIGSKVTSTGNLSANGGNSTSGAGGDGDYIWIMSSEGTSSVSGSRTVSGGTGTPAGATGSIIIDGVSAAPVP